MVRKQDRTSWKADYFIRILSAFDEYPKCFIVNVDNVGSKQMQEIRTSLRGHAQLLMGKNTMIRKAIRGHLQQNPGLEKLLPFIVGNVGFVFTNEDLSDIKTKILENKVAAPAKVGSIAPLDVSIPPQNTGMGPEKTSFFQALNIPTKISRGTIEILNDVKLITEGEKVGASEATLLQMMDIKPFTYGLVILRVFDSGSVFEPEILDITDEDIRDMFLKGVRNVASVSLAIGYPTMASVPHTIATVFRNLLAIAAQTDVTFKEAETMKEYLADPSKAAEAVAALVAPAEAAPAQEAPKAAAPAEDSESDEDMGLGLFDD